MALSGLSTPMRRDALLVLVALVLLAAPMWVPALHIDDTTYRYESVAVTTNGTELAFASAPTVEGVGISDRIVCSAETVSRSCYIERFIATNNTVPTGLYTGAGDMVADRPGVVEHYDYVLINGTVYDTVFVPNRSAPRKNGAIRLDAGLTPVEAARALRFVSVPIDDVSPSVRKAARTGVAYGHRRAIPATPIELTDDTYRRVYVANISSPPDFYSRTESLLMVGGPLVGLGLLAWVQRRINITITVTHGEQ